LFGVEFLVSDDHERLKQAIREVLPGAVWQRCYVHYADLRIMPTCAWKPAPEAVIAAMGSA
jgi:transposase-like protein